MDAVLVLNSTYEPMNVVRLARAVRLLFAGKAEVVVDRGLFLHAQMVEFPMPSIIRMLYYIKNRRKTVSMTKKNVLLRDDYKCGYCNVKGGHEMTVDHILPRAQGGKSSWQNLVACCERCNGRKRDRTPEQAGMMLLRKPYIPKYIPWIVIKRNTVPSEWAKFLGLYEVGIEERVG